MIKHPKVWWNDEASHSLIRAVQFVSPAALWWPFASGGWRSCRPVVPIIEIEINNPPAVWQEWHHILSRSYNNWKASRSLARVLHCPCSLEPYSGLYKHAVIPWLPVGNVDNSIQPNLDLLNKYFATEISLDKHQLFRTNRLVDTLRAGLRDILVEPRWWYTWHSWKVCKSDNG